MLRFTSWFIVVGLCCIMLSPAANATLALKRTRGTMSAGGVFTLPIEWDPVRQTSLSLNLAPEFGIFLFDGFQLSLQAHLKTALYHERLAFGSRESSYHWGLGVGTQYVFDLDWPLMPFVGLNLGYEMANFLLATTHIAIGVPLGVLLPLSESFALSFGVSTQVLLVGQLKIFDKLRFEPGCLGIRAFF